MKKATALFLIILCFFLLCACSDSHRGEAIFNVENVAAVYLGTVNPLYEPVAVADEYMDEILQWLESWTVGSKADKSWLEPGNNSQHIIVEYRDGSTVSVGTDYIEIDEKLYCVMREPYPECISEIRE